MKNRALTFFGPLIAAALLVSCGGGSSHPQTTLGTVVAADGSAMSFARITIKSLVDTTQDTQTANIDGSVNIPSTVTFPAIVKAQSLDASRVNYGYIANNQQIDAPVNPLSTFVLAVASNGNPASITSSSQLTAASLASAKSSVNSIFSNIFSAFNVAASTDLLSTSFATNHTGVDLIMDAMSIAYDPAGNPTVCTKISNACKSFVLSSLDTAPISISAQTVSLINSVPIAACSNVIYSLTTSTITGNAGLYHANFLNSGLNSADYRSALSARFNGVAATFNAPTFVGTDDNGNYIFQFFIYNTATGQYAGGMSMAFNTDAQGHCVMVGDKLPFWINVGSQITYQVRVDNSALNTVAAATTQVAGQYQPVAGLFFKASGDSFGRSTQAMYDITVNGVNYSIDKLQFNMCNANNQSCTPLIEMRLSTGNYSGFYYVPNNINTLPVLSYTAANILTPNDYYNGNPNPIQVRMLDAGGTTRKTVNLKIRGQYISPNSSINPSALPAVTNASSVLSTGTNLVNPSLNVSIPTGTLVQSLALTNGPTTGLPTTTSSFILTGSSSANVLNTTINVSTDNYRSISIGGSTTGGIPIYVKYVWSPTCAGCS